VRENSTCLAAKKKKNKNGTGRIHYETRELKKKKKNR